MHIFLSELTFSQEALEQLLLDPVVTSQTKPTAENANVHAHLLKEREVYGQATATAPILRKFKTWTPEN